MEAINQIFSKTQQEDMEQKIVEELLNSNDNLAAKTELHKPLKWSCIKMMQEFINDRNMPKSSKILNSFVETSFKYLISKDRQGRKEYIEALRSITGQLGVDKKQKQISGMMSQ